VTEQYPPIRRFVTGHSADNVAKAIMEGPATNAKRPSPAAVSTLIWSTDRTPADISIGEEVEDLGARIIGTAPLANGRGSPSSISRPAMSPECTAPRRSTT
jgi:hypothetical protein